LEAETARGFYQKALEIRERLAAQEPDRADYAVDLAGWRIHRLMTYANLHEATAWL
jgi:hypothetical protein